ncbi:MAG: DUF1844 domain-containing protein [Ignavibacteria bacterium]|nr:DUF1844 domain-containing protein [Ignavibacteria bacterium]
MDVQQKSTLLFSQIVIMFHAFAMQQLGKVKNPVTDKIERDLIGAQNSIDMLDMLKEKTKGNLTKDEERLITDTLKELRLNYVDESGKPEPAKPAEEPTPPEPSGTQPEEGKKSE